MKAQEQGYNVAVELQVLAKAIERASKNGEPIDASDKIQKLAEMLKQYNEMLEAEVKQDKQTYKARDFRAIRDAKGITLYNGNKVGDYRKTKVAYTHIVVYEEAEGYYCNYCKSLRNAEKHHWWLLGHDFTKRIIEVEDTTNDAEEISKKMGKLFLK
jgi:hypothetical protein